MQLRRGVGYRAIILQSRKKLTFLWNIKMKLLKLFKQNIFFILPHFNFYPSLKNITVRVNFDVYVSISIIHYSQSID